MGNQHGIIAYPQSPDAMAWLNGHREELRLAFREEHRQVGELVHSLALVLPTMTTESDFDPTLEPAALFISISIHGLPGHLQITLRDFQRVMTRLGAPISKFEIEAND